MSLIKFELHKTPGNFTLKKLFTKVTKAYRSGSVDAVSTPIGNGYILKNDNFDADFYFNEAFSNDPNSREMKTKNINSLYNQVINGDNYVDCEWMDNPVGNVIISTGNGDDIINVEAGLSQNTKKYYVNAGKGDDIIGCSVEFDDDFGTKSKPSVSFKGGKGSDVFIGVPEGLIGRVKDFDVKHDFLGFDGDIKKHRFYETRDGVAIVDMRKSDGMLILEGVNSIDQINTLNDLNL